MEGDVALVKIILGEIWSLYLAAICMMLIRIRMS